MKISQRITLLVVFLVIGMIVNTFTGLSQLKKVGNEFRQVAEGDMAITEIVTAVAQHQLEKAILFERLQRVAEEIAFETITPARKLHLFDHIEVTKRGFDYLSQKVGRLIIEGRNLISDLLQKDFPERKRSELLKVQKNLEAIEKAHISYDNSVADMIERVKSEKLQISFEDLSTLRRDELRLSKAIKELLSQVQGFTRNSVSKAEEAENVAAEILIYTLMFTIMIGAIVAGYLIVSISRPLKRLVNAANAIGSGQLDVKVATSGNVEINEVSTAFNTMTEQLSAAQTELEKKNQALASNLKLVEEQKQDLEKVNRELDNFVGTVSHDIRSPLTGISGYATILDNQYHDSFDKRGQRCLTGIKNGIERMNNMIIDLLELTKISRVRNPYEETDMDNLIDSIIARLEYRIAEKNVEVNIQDSMPTVFCDRIKIGEVFHNLISNALKFSSKVDRPPVLDIGFHENKEDYEFWVKDNGIGIAPEDQDKVFGIFKRLESAKEYEGTGAGLSIVKGIVEEHKGRIWINSEVEKYTAFHFTVSKHLVNESH
ncbi:MAG: HAMP domain-containing protein [Candidatus Omnitrophica bacterium]|nr:HAMP domain-containing protein [Candidatus Omnitrophota bacterium]MCB9719291.1 HAMP domain-containing protein [Candidatus Omnitrophota bacterium]